MKTIQKGFVVPLLLALIALVLIGGGTYVYSVQKNQENQPATGSVTLPQATSTIPTPKQTTSTTQTSNSQTTDWKTYTNTQYGFSLKYPNDLKIEEVSKTTSSLFKVKIYDANYKASDGIVGQQIRTGQKSVTITILEKSDANLNTIEKNITLQEPGDKTNLWSEKVITVDGEAVKFYALWSGLSGNNYESYFLGSDYIFDAVSFQGDLLKEILSTFKFT